MNIQPNREITESLEWLDESLRQPGVIRSADFLQRLQEGSGNGRALLFSRRDRPHSPGQLKLFEDIRALLKGHAHIRFVATDTGWRATPQASRLVGMLDKYFFNVLKAARETAARLAALDAVGYVQHIYQEEGEADFVTQPVPYSTATQACPAGLTYLDWMLNTACKQQGHRSVALRNRLEADAEVWYAENLGETTLRNDLLQDFTTLVQDDDPNYDRVEVDRAGLERAVQKEHAQWLARLQPSDSAVKPVSGEDNAVKGAFDGRPAPDSNAWPWRGMRVSQYAGSVGWPFPIRMEVSDRAKAEKLHKEGAVRQQLGAVFTQTNGYGVDSASPQSAEATQAWQKLEDAGRTLQTLGMALMVLAQGLSSKRRCSVCQRHLGPKGDRTRCELHRADAGVPGKHSGQRTDIYRMDVWGVVAQKQWQALLADMRNSPAALEAARTVRRWWGEPIRISANGSTSNTPQIRLAMAKLNVLIESLEPWVGKTIRGHLLALAGHIEQKLLDNAKPTQGEGTQPQGPVVKLLQHELSPEVFFGLHIAGYETATLPSDRWHPLAKLGAAAYAPNDLLRDLLLQRAWVESGGMQMDWDRNKQMARMTDKKALHVRVSPPPSQRKRQIVADKAFEMKKDGYSYVEIARHFEVSPAAVTKFFQRNEKSHLQPKGEATKPTKRP